MATSHNAKNDYVLLIYPPHQESYLTTSHRILAPQGSAFPPRSWARHLLWAYGVGIWSAVVQNAGIFARKATLAISRGQAKH